jgi:hypothetical protein
MCVWSRYAVCRVPSPQPVVASPPPPPPPLPQLPEGLEDATPLFLASKFFDTMGLVEPTKKE